MNSNNHRSETNGRKDPTTAALSGVWTHRFKLYTEEDDLVPVSSGPLVDAWCQQCNKWSTKHPKWHQLAPFDTCLNSMISMGYASMLEGPEDTRAFACDECQHSQTFCVVLDVEKDLLRLLPREKAFRSTGFRVTDLSTYIHPMENPHGLYI